MHQIHQTADLRIHPRDHRRISRLRFKMREVAMIAGIGFILPETRVLPQRIVRNLKREVRDCRGSVKEKWPLFVLPYKCPRLLGDQVGGILAPLVLLVGNGIFRVCVCRKFSMRGKSGMIGNCFLVRFRSSRARYSGIVAGRAKVFIVGSI